MEGLLPIGVILILVALGALANVMGVDSRDFQDERARPALGDN